MHKNLILTTKRRRHAQSNCTNTKLKAFCAHTARKCSGSILHSRTHTGDVRCLVRAY